MSLLDTAREDLAIFTGDLNDFGIEITFITPDDVKTVIVVGYATKHHTKFDEDGVRVSSKVASVSVMEKFLTDLGYPVRQNSEVNMVDHKVSFADSTGNVRNYKITEMFPDESLGLITFMLSDLV